jgi:NhaP-type Na+/H+ or K+/H+ antiporter
MPRARLGTPAGLSFLAPSWSMGGVLLGAAVAWLAVQVRRRLDDPLHENVTMLLTPFAASCWPRWSRRPAYSPWWSPG